MNNIENKVIVITGASSGLGEASAKALSAKGAILVLAARRLERIDALVEEFSKNEKKALAVQTDVTDFTQMQTLMQAAVNKFGRIDVLLNNAGIMPSTPIMDCDVTTWNQVINVNINGVLNGIAAVLPYFKEQKSGHIINVSSVAAHKIGKGSGIYSATKTAVRAISEGLRMEAKDFNIRTTIISPGVIDTELPSASGIPDESTKQFYQAVAIPADSFARVVEFAISQPKEVDINEILFRPTRQEY
ncbi:SDR family oxidoreductase [Flavobacterium sp. ov086]|uniref:SDR family oxidoreductase n=1 Tax=Flavobacterium sp. ov086 TaxID=1761785 RepID=UPI000B68EC5F|nr:SDR family oxidoreductase [Flavobacterium sp. ov086]SNR41588.1 NADP-dependent 3-hydroxy acid dehydrogenase YdfG [Flavobacterium sp. ov086]